jgi:hypothetical protein
VIERLLNWTDAQAITPVYTPMLRPTTVEQTVRTADGQTCQVHEPSLGSHLPHQSRATMGSLASPPFCLLSKMKQADWLKAD